MVVDAGVSSRVPGISEIGDRICEGIPKAAIIVIVKEGCADQVVASGRITPDIGPVPKATSFPIRGDRGSAHELIAIVIEKCITIWNLNTICGYNHSLWATVSIIRLAEKKKLLPSCLGINPERTHIEVPAGVIHRQEIRPWIKIAGERGGANRGWVRALCHCYKWQSKAEEQTCTN